jgi:putative hemolysin
MSVIAIIFVACSEPSRESNSTKEQTEEESPQLANPASENCIKHGGSTSIERRGDGGEYGICLFEDNRQCEEWAMFRGDCPVGGVKVTGYVTPAARYCAITGGEYTVTINSNMEDEQGTCFFKNGKKCDAWEYFNGDCGPV